MRLSKNNKKKLSQKFEFCNSLLKSKMVAGGGFEPPKASLADLQSAPFDRSGIQPYIKLSGFGKWSG